MQPVYVAILAVIAAVIGLVAVAVMTRLHFPTVWIRKLSHLGSTAVIIAIALLFGYKLFIVVGLVVALVLLIVKLVRPPTALTTKEARDSYGEVFFFVGITLTALIATTVEAFIVPVLVLGLADTAAYVIGRSIKSPKLLFSKTLAGSLAFAVVAFILFISVGPWWLALIGALVTSLAELVGQRGSDNLTVPVTAALLLTLL